MMRRCVCVDWYFTKEQFWISTTDELPKYCHFKRIDGLKMLSEKHTSRCGVHDISMTFVGEAT